MERIPNGPWNRINAYRGHLLLYERRQHEARVRRSRDARRRLSRLRLTAEMADLLHATFSRRPSPRVVAVLRSALRARRYLPATNHRPLTDFNLYIATMYQIPMANPYRRNP